MLYQSTIDFLKANPEIKLGDALPAGVQATLTKPTLWYETQSVNGQQVLVPQLLMPVNDRVALSSLTSGTMNALTSLQLNAGDIVVRIRPGLPCGFCQIDLN